MNRVLLAVVLFLAPTPSLLSAETLADLMQQQQTEWIIGRWTGGEEFGEHLQVEFAWALDQHAVLIDVQSNQGHTKAMVTYNPAKSKVLHASADNRGGTGTGEWTADAGNATLIYEHTDSSGQQSKLGIQHRRVDADTMRVEIYEVRPSGELAESPSMSAAFKRVTGSPN